MSKQRWNQGKNFPWIFDFAAQIRVRIFLQDGALSSLSKKYTPNLRHPKNPKVQANSTAFSQWFLWALDPGMRRCFWMCQYFYADKPTL